jgi:glutamate decarboxylase
VTLKHPKAPEASAESLSVPPLFTLESMEVPRHLLPERQLPPDVPYQLIHDELKLDGNARLNVATFVTTWMEAQAEKLMAECFDKNMIDKDEYPQTAEIETRCVNILSRLWARTRRSRGDGLFDDRVERGRDARGARAQAPLAAQPPCRG